MKNFTDTISLLSARPISQHDRGAYYEQQASQFAAGLPPAERLRREENGRQPNVSKEYVPLNTNQSFA